MSVRAGSIVTVAGQNVVDRLQSVGLGDAQIPVETIREVGNDLVVDKIPGEPDFTFSMESWDVSTDLMAFLHGRVGTLDVDEPPGSDDPEGTEYKWEDCQFVNVTSPWKSNVGSAGGDIAAGLLIPGYYPTRLRYRFGVTDNAVQECELSGGSFYYAKVTPVEETAEGDGMDTTFVTSEDARALRLGGPDGTSFQRVFGVLVDGVLQVNHVDYEESVADPEDVTSDNVTITFTDAPADGAVVKFCYFTETDKAIPQEDNADATVKPGAVRGRNIVTFLGPRGTNAVQSLTIDATSGTYTLTLLGDTTAAIDFDATAAEVQAALEATDGVELGEISVTGEDGGPYNITFQADLGQSDQDLIVTDDALLVGGTASAVVAEVTAGTAGSQLRLPGIQTIELEATIEGEVEREMGNDQITGRTVNGTDVTGTFTVRPKDIDAFFATLTQVTGVDEDEVYSYFNQESTEVEIQIQDPKNPEDILKTLYVKDGQFQPPGTPGRVNQSTDFGFQFNSVNGTFSEYKGRKP